MRRGAHVFGVRLKRRGAESTGRALIMHNECMSLIQIRDVPESVRDELARKAAAAGQSMQAYLLAELSKLAERPSMAEIVRRAQARAKATGSTVTMDDAVAACATREIAGRSHERIRSRRIRRRDRADRARDRGSRPAGHRRRGFPGSVDFRRRGAQRPPGPGPRPEVRPSRGGGPHRRPDGASRRPMAHVARCSPACGNCATTSLPTTPPTWPWPS